jgi:hypothetical protein
VLFPSNVNYSTDTNSTLVSAGYITVIHASKPNPPPDNKTDTGFVLTKPLLYTIIGGGVGVVVLVLIAIIAIICIIRRRQVKMKQDVIRTEQHPYMKGRSKIRIKRKKGNQEDNKRVDLYDDGGDLVAKHPVTYGGDMQGDTKSNPDEENRTLITGTKKSGNYAENILYNPPQNNTLSQFDSLFGFTGSVLPETQPPQQQTQQHDYFQQLQQREFGLPQAVVLETFNAPPPVVQQSTSSYIPPRFDEPQKLLDQDAAVHGFKGGFF